MIATSEVDKKREKNDTDDPKKSQKSSGDSKYWLILLGIIAIEGAVENRRLSEIRDAVNFQNLLILNLMSGDVTLPADTMSYEEANRLYVQTIQQPKLLQPIGYNK